MYGGQGCGGVCRGVKSVLCDNEQDIAKTIDGDKLVVWFTRLFCRS
jgi:hypothetical protein